MTTDPDPFEEGPRAARKNIPAEGNPYRDGSDEHSLWAAALAELAQGPGLIEFRRVPPSMQHRRSSAS
jgi:hypothetical protein